MEKMEKNREGFLVGKTKRQCTNCRKIFTKKSKTVTLCNDCNSNRVKSQSLESKMFFRAKARADKRGIAFNISKTDIVIPTECPVLGIDLYVTEGKSGAFNSSPSLDRIDPTKGYIKGNIMVISSLANTMKNNATPEQLIAFANWVFKNYSDTAQN